jgi:Ni/Co efflux regulator RcnB
MKRLALILATVATTAFGPVALNLAHAGDQDNGRWSSQGRQGGGWEQRQGRGGDRGGSQREVRGPDRGGRYGDERRGQYPERGGAPYGEGRGARYPERGGPYPDERGESYPERGGRYVEDRRGPPAERGRYSDERRRPAPERGERYGDDSRGRREDPGPYGRGPPGYPAPYPRASGVRPGGYLPPNYRGAPVEDYRRYRLRPPPRGYNWVRVGDGFALVSPDGQIFDMVR